jgi:hypothetical protein
MFRKSLLALALGTTASLLAMSATAATLATGDVLNIVTGTVSGAGGATAGTTSWFGMDTNASKTITLSEETPLFMGTTGIVVGSTTSPGASHGSLPTAGDTNAIDKPWGFFGNTGSDFVTTGITGGTAGVVMSGWRVTWNGIPSINMGGTAWGAGFTSGVGNFTWDGIYGDAYTLDYHATVPVGDPSGFGGVRYALHLTGTVTSVPEASTYGMMLAGLGLVGFAARRRKQR